MDKFIYYINQDVCIKEIFLNDQPLLNSDEGNSTSSATPRFELGHKRKINMWLFCIGRWLIGAALFVTQMIHK